MGVCDAHSGGGCWWPAAVLPIDRELRMARRHALLCIVDCSMQCLAALCCDWSCRGGAFNGSYNFGRTPVTFVTPSPAPTGALLFAIETGEGR